MDNSTGHGMRFWIALTALLMFIAGIAAILLAVSWALPDLSTAGMLLVVAAVLVGALSALHPGEDHH